MSEPDGTPENSMEAILASIRRIIAEDGIQPPPGVRPAPLTRPEPSIQPNPLAVEPSPPPPSPPPPSPPPPNPPAPPVAARPASQPVFTVSLIDPAPAAAPKPAPQPPTSAPAPVPAPDLLAPQAVWGVLGDRAIAGEELVLTQMVAEDGSVVALAKPGSLATASPRPPTEPLDVLLLTDALPGSMPDVAMPVAPPQKPVPPSAPLPAPAPVLAAKPPAASAPPEPVQPVSPPPPAPKPSVDADRPRVGLAAPETLVTSAAVLEQLARVRSQVRAAQPNPPAGSIATANLEELVRQSLEPKIQEWLNANLLQIVERLVQQEIDRISSRT